MAEDVKYTIELEAEEIEKRLNEIPQMQEDIEYLKENGGGGGGIISETDPTVPAWAKQPTKPTYTAEEVGALPADTVIPEEVYIGNETPTDENIKIWIDTSEEAEFEEYVETVALLAETDMLPAVYDESGILCDENKNVILRY